MNESPTSERDPLPPLLVKKRGAATGLGTAPIPTTRGSPPFDRAALCCTRKHLTDARAPQYGVNTHLSLAHKVNGWIFQKIAALFLSAWFTLFLSLSRILPLSKRSRLLACLSSFSSTGMSSRKSASAAANNGNSKSGVASESRSKNDPHVRISIRQRIDIANRPRLSGRRPRARFCRLPPLAQIYSQAPSPQTTQPHEPLPSRVALQCVNAYTAIFSASFCPSSGLTPLPRLQLLFALNAQHNPSSHITATRFP